LISSDASFCSKQRRKVELLSSDVFHAQNWVSARGEGDGFFVQRDCSVLIAKENPIRIKYSNKEG